MYITYEYNEQILSWNLLYGKMHGNAVIWCKRNVIVQY